MIKEMLKHFQLKLKDEKGEVSVEWALVAVAMGSVIILVFNPGISAALSTAIATISGYLTTA
jgi:Flp pilus assembly pilin Flp